MNIELDTSRVHKVCTRRVTKSYHSFIACVGVVENLVYLDENRFIFRSHFDLGNVRMSCLYPYPVKKQRCCVYFCLDDFLVVRSQTLFSSVFLLATEKSGFVEIRESGFLDSEIGNPRFTVSTDFGF